MEIRLDPILNPASGGLALARQVLDALNSANRIVLDFSAVDRMTPSFANAFVMTLLERMALQQLHENVVMVNRNEQVIQAIEESSRRYNRGIRLSIQQPALA